MKISQKAKERFEYFAKCEDANRMPRIPLSIDGFSALECFHARETYGKDLPCREPEILSRALNGKEWHGLTVTHCAEDFIGRILFTSDIRENYPDWVQRDIFGRARQLAMRMIGFVPKFVQTGVDFTA